MLWNVEGTKPVAVIAGQSRFYCYAFTPDSKLLAVVDGEGVIRFHDTQTGGEVLRWDAGAIAAARLVFTPDGRRHRLWSRAFLTFFHETDHRQKIMFIHK